MPIYDYLCSSCGERTEVMHGIEAPAPRFCPACGSEGTLRKAFVVPAIVFKGSGWAKKDRSGGSGTRAKSDSAASGSDDKPSSGDGTKGSAVSDTSGGAKPAPSTGAGMGADH